MKTQNRFSLIALTLLLNAESIYGVETTEVVPAIAQIESNLPALAAQTTRADANDHPEVKMKSPVDPICRRGEVHADFLFWAADEDGLEYGTKMISGPLIGTAAKTKTRLLDLDFEWNPGFRIGLGAIFDRFDCWTLDLNWTYMRNHANGHSSAKGIESQTSDTNTIISPWVNLLFELRAGASDVKAHWIVNYNTLDLDFGKRLALSERFTMSPHFGFRGAWIDQEYYAKYKSVFLLAEGATPFSRHVNFRAKNDFTAFGLRGGTELMCLFCKNWHVFSELTGNILYGEFRVKMKNNHDQGLGEGGIPPSPLDFSAKEHLRRVRLNFEEAVGVGYDAFFNKNRYRLRFRAAYEMSQWLNQNELFYTLYFQGQDTVSSVPIRSQGDLSFHGIRLGAQFDF